MYNYIPIFSTAVHNVCHQLHCEDASGGLVYTHAGEPCHTDLVCFACANVEHLGPRLSERRTTNIEQHCLAVRCALPSYMHITDHPCLLIASMGQLSLSAVCEQPSYAQVLVILMPKLS